MVNQEQVFRQETEVRCPSVVLSVEEQEYDNVSTIRHLPVPFRKIELHEDDISNLKMSPTLVPSFTNNSKDRRSGLPEVRGFTGPWPRLCHSSKQNKDSDPESLLGNKKSFYQRTWFACTLYSFALSILIASILAIAVNRAILIPKTTLEGEILPTTDRSQPGRVLDSIFPTMAPGSVATGTPVTSENSVSSLNRAGPTLLQVTSTVTTAMPEITTTSFLTTRVPDIAALLLRS